MYANMKIDEDTSPKRGVKFSREIENKFSPQTLQGNWYENRLKYQYPKFKNETVYKTEYVPKKSSSLFKEYWDNSSAGQEGVDPIIHSRSGCEDYPNFFENFTSTTDLSYNHFPKWHKDVIQIHRHYRSSQDKYFPMDEYLDPYHNLTQFGLKEYKNQLRESLSDTRWPVNTVYTDSYPAPHIDCYEFPRWAKPRCLSSTLMKTSDTLEALRLRGWNPGFFVPTPSHPVLFKKRETCNMFTWECPPEQKVCVPKHQWKNCLGQQRLV